MKVVDLNLLLYAINVDAPQHERARAWWEETLSVVGCRLSDQGYPLSAIRYPSRRADRQPTTDSRQHKSRSFSDERLRLL